MTGDAALMEAIQLLGLDTPWTMAERGDLDGLRLMATVERAIDLDQPDLARGWTPVMYAASRNWPAVIVWLRSRGADVHRRLESGLSCAYLAAVGGNVDVLELLIKYGCALDHDVDETSAIEVLCTPGQGAASLYGARLECACLLVLGGATVSAGYVSADVRPMMMGWALAEMASDYAPILVALGATHGLGPDRGSCILGCLDGRALSLVGSFLRRPRREARRVGRALWVWTSETRDREIRMRAVSQGYRRSDRCFSVF